MAVRVAMDEKKINKNLKNYPKSPVSRYGPLTEITFVMFGGFVH